MNLQQISDHEITFSRTFAAPRDLVWRAFTDPKMLANWWGPRHLTNVVEHMDVRPGGTWRIVQRDLDGTEYGFHGEYRAVEAPARVVQTMEFEGFPGAVEVDTLTLEERDGQTIVRAHVAFSSPEHLAGMQAGHMEVGMTDSYDRLQDVLVNGDRSDRMLQISRAFQAPRELVWRAWTEREQVDRWYGPRGFRTETFEMNVRPGGVWRAVMHGPDGEDYHGLAQYREVTPPKRLVYQHSSGEEGDAGFEMTVTFLAFGDVTIVTIQQVYPTAEQRNGVAEWAVPGAQSTLERLAETLAAG